MKSAGSDQILPWQRWLRETPEASQSRSDNFRCHHQELATTQVSQAHQNPILNASGTNTRQRLIMTSLNITGYHSHVYFEADTLSQARGLIQAAGKDLPVVVGRIHEKPVGPHTRWSCQLAYEPGSFEQVMSWLAVHRNGLTVFTHPLTGDPVAEHQDFAIWMGSIEPLNIEILEELVTTQNSASWLYRSRTSLDNLAIELSEESNKI